MTAYPLEFHFCFILAGWFLGILEQSMLSIVLSLSYDRSNHFINDLTHAGQLIATFYGKDI